MRPVILHKKPWLFRCINTHTDEISHSIEEDNNMKLLNNISKIIFLLLPLAFLVIECEAHIKAQGQGWSFEAAASARTEIKRH